MAVTNGSGVGRVDKKPHTNGNPTVSSLDDDPTQACSQVVAYTSQAMIVANAAGKTTPNNMIV
jgi:hypothetical protein